MITAFLIVVSLFVISYNLIKSKRNKGFKVHLPPGPTGFPLIGYWPGILGDKPYEVFDLWAKKYGNIYRVRIGGKMYCVLNNFDAIRQAYILDGKGNNFLNRPQHYHVLGSAFEFRALGTKNGGEWALQRKLFGILMRRNDPRVKNATDQSAKEIVHRIQNVYKDGPIDVYNILAEEVLNIVSTLVCGQRLAETNPTYAQQIICDARQIFAIAPAGDGFLFGWIVRLLVNPFTEKYKILNQMKTRQFKALAQLIQEHELTFDPSNLRDYIDVCLNERLKSEAHENVLSNINLVANALLFFAAGIDTTAATIYFAMFLLAKYQDIQEKCYDELISVVGEDFNGLIKASDKSKFPYLTAVIDEINRYGILAPLPQGRVNIEKTTLFEYDIPAGSDFLTNLWSATRDSKYFSNPNEFDPNNFYQKDLPREMTSLAFSLGKRACPGENLATMEIFVFLSHLLLNFKFFPESDFELKENIMPGLVRAISPFKLIFTKRSK